MFNIKVANNNLIIDLGGNISFDVNFHKNIAEIVHYYSLFKGSIGKVEISCDQLPSDSICSSYLHSILCYFNQDSHIPIYAKGELFSELQNIRRGTEREFLMIFDLSLAGRKQYFCFSTDSEVRIAVEKLVDIIIGTSLVKDRILLKRFMMGTIVELYSNCILHSTKTECELIYAVSKINGEFFFDVNVTDYGKTIYENVTEYFEYEKIEPIDNCVGWAIGERHTTRKNSTGGYGLTSLCDYISKVRGNLVILSGPEVLYFNDGRMACERMKYNFSGTSVSFRIKLFDFSRIVSLNGDKIESFSLNEILGGKNDN